MKVKILIFFLLFALFVPQALAAKPSESGKPNPPLSVPNSVCIDAGHGGDDAGTANGDLLEKDVNLDVAKRLETQLTNASYTVFMTRTGNETLSNADRYNYCNSQRAAILVSIHHNGSTDSNLDYSSALYMKKPDVALAGLVVGAVSSQLGLQNHGTSRFASGVLLKADMPATISEGFFLTSDYEYNLIKNSNRLDQEATALFASIRAYFGN